MARFDPHRHEQIFKRWQAKGCTIPDVSEESRSLILAFIEDMEVGANVSPVSKKGARSYGRLRNIKTKMQTLTILFQQEIGITSLAEMVGKERELLQLIKRIREGQFKGRRKPTETFKAIGTYMKAFKAFWHWYQRTQRKQGKDILDITQDIDARDEKPKFNYFTINDVRILCDNAKYDYRVLMMFLFDTGIRAPTELMNVKVSDLEWNEKQNHYTLSIREETSKTFGRRIKLLLCSGMLKEYIQNTKLRPDDYLFKKSPQRANQYLRNLGKKYLDKGEWEAKTYAGRSYKTVKDGITMYDFRHSSACYWLPRYKSESALKYRFGWKKSDMIHYYTELLGMKDTIQEEDLYVDISKTEMEKQILEKGSQINILQEQLKNQEQRMEEMLKILQTLEIERKFKNTV
jgi:integrase